MAGMQRSLATIILYEPSTQVRTMSSSMVEEERRPNFRAALSFNLVETGES